MKIWQICVTVAEAGIINLTLVCLIQGEEIPKSFPNRWLFHNESRCTTQNLQGSRFVLNIDKGLVQPKEGKTSIKIGLKTKMEPKSTKRLNSSFPMSSCNILTGWNMDGSTIPEGKPTGAGRFHTYASHRDLLLQPRTFHLAEFLEAFRDTWWITLADLTTWIPLLHLLTTYLDRNVTSILLLFWNTCIWPTWFIGPGI